MFFSKPVLLWLSVGGAHLTFSPPRAHDRVILTLSQLKTLVNVCRSKE